MLGQEVRSSFRRIAIYSLDGDKPLLDFSRPSPQKVSWMMEKAASFLGIVLGHDLTENGHLTIAQGCFFSPFPVEPLSPCFAIQVRGLPSCLVLPVCPTVCLPPHPTPTHPSALPGSSSQGLLTPCRAGPMKSFLLNVMGRDHLMEGFGQESDEMGIILGPAELGLVWFRLPPSGAGALSPQGTSSLLCPCDLLWATALAGAMADLFRPLPCLVSSAHMHWPGAAA